MTKKVLKKKKPIKKKKAPQKKPHTLAEQVSEAGLVMEACGNDEKVAAFFLLWLQNGRRADLAYIGVNPNVTKRSAETLGSRMLSRVERSVVAQAYGLGYDEYFKQLKEGLKATRLQSINFETHEVDDHKTRRDYHKALGEIIGMEKPNGGGGNTAIQVNVGKAVNDWIVTE